MPMNTSTSTSVNPSTSTTPIPSANAGADTVIDVRSATPGRNPRPAAADTGARTEEAADVIASARERIDALDDRIIGLVQERMAISAVVQEARISSGGRRVSLSREMEVLGHYRDALGKPGTSLAMTLLELCRGRI
ncbi:chorismate mutase [Streptomyces sp. NPDC004609]|uniref:chorismate mutase n=1 Tax=Streptomyces sp. NPDC004609 TaxID=3364704 RepID=UPI0036B59967